MTKKINFIAGGVWDLPYITNLFSHVKKKLKRIITSIPKKIYKKNNFNVIFLPKYLQIFEKLFKIKFYKYLRLLDDYQFSYLASKFVNNGDIVWGYQGFQYHSLIKNTNGLNILHRSCPHIQEQEHIKREQCMLLDLTYKNKPDRFNKRVLIEYEKSDYIVVPSTFTQNSFLKRGFDKKKVILLPILDLNKNLNFNLKKKTDREIVFGYVGGDFARKGIYYLLSAWKKANLKKNKLIVKSDLFQISKSSVIKSLIHNQNNIQFVKYYLDVSDFYNQIDVLIFPSTDDGFGMVVTEALHFRKFVIVSKNSGASELVLEGKNGYTYNYNDIEALTSLIVSVAKNRNSISNESVNQYELNLKFEREKVKKFVNKIENCL